jgi:hypothetical protein
MSLWNYKLVEYVKLLTLPFHQSSGKVSSQLSIKSTGTTLLDIDSQLWTQYCATIRGQLMWFCPTKDYHNTKHLASKLR